MTVGAGLAGEMCLASAKKIAGKAGSHRPAATIGLFLLLLSSTLHADYQAGLDAYTAGDYVTAMAEWREVTDGPPTAVSPGVFVETHYAVAMLYWEGRGVTQDFSQSRHWLERAAGMNHAGAQVKLGFLYTDGKGVPQDHARAFEWFSKAARKGNVDALYNLGVSYLYGWGTEPDATLAKQYLAAASALGDPAAEQALQNLLADPVGADVGVGNVGAQVDVGAGLAGDMGPQSPARPAPTRPAPTRPAPTRPAPTDPGPLIHDETWILARDPEHYTLQVILLSSPEKLRALVAGHESLAPFAIYTLQGAGRPLYALVQGEYPDLSSARRARDAFPPAIEKPDALWIRSFGQVQEHIRD